MRRYPQLSAPESHVHTGVCKSPVDLAVFVGIDMRDEYERRSPWPGARTVQLVSVIIEAIDQAVSEPLIVLHDPLHARLEQIFQDAVHGMKLKKFAVPRMSNDRAIFGLSGCGK